MDEQPANNRNTTGIQPDKNRTRTDPYATSSLSAPLRLYLLRRNVTAPIQPSAPICQPFPRRNRTIRLVLVPLAMLSTPQQLAVLVKCWSLMSTSIGSSPAATPQGRTASSSLVFPA